MLETLNANRKKPNVICTARKPIYAHCNIQKANTLCMQILRANIMILFGAELQFMNGGIRANIHVRKMTEN
jgi:hypothetical protein